MQTVAIEQEIRSFLVKHFLAGRADKLRDDGSLLGDVIDSVGVLELVTYLQEQFAISVEDADVIPGNLDSVNNLVAYVARKLGTTV
ncbi:MAG: acyl carrier protein [Candidatus Sulfotelmatobacter sp.]|jgi:acyl carrier protein